MPGKKSPVAIKAIDDTVLAQHQPVGRTIHRHDRLAVVRLQRVHEPGAH